MNRRMFLKSVFAAGLSAGLAAEGWAAGKAKKPNIVVFLVDDMGWQDTSLPFWKEQTFLNRRHDTPGMCALAKDGVMFTSAYAQAVCTPTRVSLITGMNAARHRVTLWTSAANRTTDAKMQGLTPPADWAMNGLQPYGIDPPEYKAGVEQYWFAGREAVLKKPFASATPLPLLLKNNGYHTILCGKAHFGARGTPGADPVNFGFEVNIGGSGVGSPSTYYGKENFGGDRNRIPGLEKYHGKDIFLTEALTLEALAALEAATTRPETREKPFFLYFGHYAVHTPIQMDPRFKEQFAKVPSEKDGSVVEQRYATLVKGMDKSLEDLVAWLKAKGLYEDTVILFLSDNGGLAVARSGRIPNANFPLRFGKGAGYEGGIRVPMIVRCPEKILPGAKKGQRCDVPVACEDFFPSILELAGVPCAVSQTVDGKSFLPFVQGKKPAEPRPLYWHCPNVWGEGQGVTFAYEPYSAVRLGDWKLIYRHLNQSLALFNLREDIGEANDLSQKNPQQTQRLARVLSDYLREVQAQMPVLTATGKHVPLPDEAFAVAKGGV